MLFCRECTCFYFFIVCLESLGHSSVTVCEYLDELRNEVCVHAGHILPYQDLSVAVCACTDTDGRDLQFFCYDRCQLRRDALQNDHECTGFLDCQRVIYDLLRLCKVLALHLEAAEHIR